MPFLLFLIALPFIEITLFLEVGKYIGVGNTLLLVICSTLLGIVLLRRESEGMLKNIRSSFDIEKNMASDSFKSACHMIGAILLIIPGFFTDLLALLLYLPFTRHLIFRRLDQKMQRNSKMKRIIEAEYIEIDISKDSKD